jgi:predicted molibdopterin-dependent oxidoreductase YjgC
MIPKYKEITIQKIGKHGIHLHSYKKDYQEIERHFYKFSIDSKSEVVTKGYPYRLLVGRNLFNYRNGLLSKQVPGMERLLGRHVIEINQKDAKKLGISNGDSLRIRSKEGIDYKGCAMVTERVQPKMVYILLSPDDPSKLFTLKGNQSFVKIEKVKYEYDC